MLEKFRGKTATDTPYDLAQELEDAQQVREKAQADAAEHRDAEAKRAQQILDAAEEKSRVISNDGYVSYLETRDSVVERGTARVKQLTALRDEVDQEIREHESVLMRTGSSKLSEVAQHRV